MTATGLASCKVALITGITGQDGSYLAELLIKKGYEVHGLIRRVAVENKPQRTSRINHILNDITLHVGDVTDYPGLYKLIKKIKPGEVYHLAAQSFVGVSFDDFHTMKNNIMGTEYLLEAIREAGYDTKFYFAASSEMFGKVEETPQKETTRFHPRSKYGISKAAGYDLTRFYRESSGMFTCSGILFNHESERRGSEFVTRKITSTAAKIYNSILNYQDIDPEDRLKLGTLNAKRDWGYAPEYVKAMWLMLQQDQPDDYVIATGETHSVGEFVIEAFKNLGIDDWEQFVDYDNPADLRPAEVDLLCGDYSKAKRILGWEPKTRFKKLVEIMIKADLKIKQ